MGLLSRGSVQSYFYLFEGLGINSRHGRLPGHDTKIRCSMPGSRRVRVPKPGKEAALPTILTRRRVRLQSVPPGPIPPGPSAAWSCPGAP
jgi:hypothetical protein